MTTCGWQDAHLFAFRSAAGDAVGRGGGEATYHDTETLAEWFAGWDPESFDLQAARRHFDM